MVSTNFLTSYNQALKIAYFGRLFCMSAFLLLISHVLNQ